MQKRKIHLRANFRRNLNSLIMKHYLHRCMMHFCPVVNGFFRLFYRISTRATEKKNWMKNFKCFLSQISDVVRFLSFYHQQSSSVVNNNNFVVISDLFFAAASFCTGYWSSLYDTSAKKSVECENIYRKLHAKNNINYHNRTQSREGKIEEIDQFAQILCRCWMDRMTVAIGNFRTSSSYDLCVNFAQIAFNCHSFTRMLRLLPTTTDQQHILVSADKYPKASTSHPCTSVKKNRTKHLIHNPHMCTFSSTKKKGKR